MSDRTELGAMYRMPTVFGPAPGPRNVPQLHQPRRYVHERTAAAIEALSEAAPLARLLPPGCRQQGEPLIRVSVSWLRDLGWLAGRGYNILTVQLPNVVFEAESKDIVGDFNAVVWESLCDPIITGREEIGFPKIWAEIPDADLAPGERRASASWMGYKFFELNLVDLAPAAGAPPTALPVLTHKYIPRTGEWGAADADYMTASAPDPLQPVSQITGYETGRGEFLFRPARWEDMPTQYPIVNALADLPLHEYRNVSVIMSSQGEVASSGGGNFSGQHIVRERSRS